MKFNIMENDTLVKPEKSGLLSATANIKVIAFFVLFGGIGILGLSVLFFIFHPLGNLFGILNGLGFIISFKGLRNLKKQGLYIYTISSALGVVGLFLGASAFPSIIAILVLIFFWINHKKFI